MNSQELCVETWDRIATFLLTQYYENNENEAIETIYIFPTPPEASVYEFEAKLSDGTIITGACKEKNLAKREYTEAIRNGNTGYYMDRLDGNIFSICIGNLAPGSKIQIRIRFVCEIDMEQNCHLLRLNIPLTIANRYTPDYVRASQRSDNIYQLTQSERSTTRPYSLTVYCTIRVSGRLVSVEVSPHRFRIIEMTGTSYQFEMIDISDLSQNITIKIERGASTSFAMTQELKEVKDHVFTYCTAININPNFSSMPRVNVNDCCYILVIDKSGSMYGETMDQCKIAATHFVAMIPFGASYDIYAFNDTYDKFTSTEQDVMRRKTEAINWINNIYPDNGTELLPVLREIYSKLDRRKNSVLIILSDGEVTNTGDVLKLVRANPHASVFSIGIGISASVELIKGLAVHGNGHYELIDASCNIRAIVRSQLEKAKDTLRKHLNDYKIEIDVTSANPGRRINVPERPAPLYEGIDNTVYVFTEKIPTEIRFITANLDGTNTVQTITPVPLRCEPMLHRIAGIKLINQLHTMEESMAPDPQPSTGSLLQHMRVNVPEEKNRDTKISNDEMKRMIIEVSQNLGILSNHTAFIGVEIKKDKIKGTMVLREIPLQASSTTLHMDPSNGDDRGLIYDTPIGVYFRNIDVDHKKTRSVRFCELDLEEDRTRSLRFHDLEPEEEEDRTQSLRFHNLEPDEEDRTQSLRFHNLEPDEDRTRGSRFCELDLDEDTSRGVRFHDLEPDEDTSRGARLHDFEPEPEYFAFACEKKTRSSIDDIDDTKDRLPPHHNNQQIDLSINNALNGTLIGIDLLCSSSNGSIVSLLSSLIENFNHQLKNGDVLKLSGEIILSHNGIYEIISTGSVDEPWVLQRITLN